MIASDFSSLDTTNALLVGVIAALIMVVGTLFIVAGTVDDDAAPVKSGIVISAVGFILLLISMGYVFR